MKNLRPGQSVELFHGHHKTPILVTILQNNGEEILLNGLHQYPFELRGDIAICRRINKWCRAAHSDVDFNEFRGPGRPVADKRIYPPLTRSEGERLLTLIPEGDDLYEKIWDSMT